MITCTRRLEWDAMHRIPRHESKCAAFHGHRYAAEITCSAPELDDLGRVVDFGVVAQRVQASITPFHVGAYHEKKTRCLPPKHQASGSAPSPN